MTKGEKDLQKKIRFAIGLTIWGLIALVLAVVLESERMIFGFNAVIFLFWGGAFLYSVRTKKDRDAYIQSVDKKEEQLKEDIRQGKVLDKETQKKLQSLENMYKYGNIDYMTYDLNRAKLLGTKSVYEQFGYRAGNAIYKKMDIDREVEEHKRTADKKIIYSGAIGSAIGGVGGTIVGASTAANQVAREGAALQQAQAAADAEVQQALKENAKLTP